MVLIVVLKLGVLREMAKSPQKAVWKSKVHIPSKFEMNPFFGYSERWAKWQQSGVKSILVLNFLESGLMWYFQSTILALI